MKNPTFPTRNGLELTEEEAYALLSLCMMSATSLDAVSEKAIHKLADFCKTLYGVGGYHLTPASCELQEAG